MRILNWNTQADRHRPDSNKLRSIRERVAGYDADVICLTEVYPEAMPDGERATAASGLSGWGWPEDRGARKVLLWSRNGWSDIDRVGSPHLPPGRFVSASTVVDGAQWKIVGMCIPYAGYRGNAARWGEQRKRKWQGACEYLEVLRCEVMADECYLRRTIFLGDFNLQIPPKNYPYPSEDVKRIREETFRGLSIPTAGDIDDPALGGRRFIDHIAFTPDIRLRSRRFFSQFADEGAELSDHNGVCIEVDEIAEQRAFCCRFSLRRQMAPVHYHEGRFPPEERLDWPRLIPLIGPAVAAVARYDGVLAAVPNPRVLLSPMTTQEAVLSSRIEGTQATMSEVLEFEAGHEATSPQRREDIHEVLNYRAAMYAAEQMLEELPLCQRVVREAHRILLSGVRGEGKSPGELRRIPNWIGPPGCTIEEATFVPVGAEKLPAAMSAWERYIHHEAPDRQVQLAVIHAEFEALHPFLDGNGRLGRMLVPLFLWQCSLISRPMFKISAWFEARRDAYYEKLLAVSRDNDWTGWCRFFLEAIRAQAEKNLTRARKILTLYEDMKGQVAEVTRSRYTILTLDWIFEHPIFNSSNFVDMAGIPDRTARRLPTALREHRILQVFRAGNGRRGTILVFPELLNVAEGRDVF